MKRTLAISLLLAMGTAGFAQTPATQNKPAQKPASVAVKPKSATAAVVNVKPSPTTVRPVAVSTQKPGSAGAKPALVQVSPVVAHTAATKSAPATAAPAAKTKTKTVAPTAAAHSTPVRPVVVAAKNGKQTAATAKVHAVIPAKDPFHGVKKVQAHATAATPTTTTVAVKDGKSETAKEPEPKAISQNGRRDPFVSPVVNLGAVGSGCSSGKRCLAIDQIALKGVVKSDTGMIAVVVNAMDKAYFLRENDPVFNGYVEKITGDSVVFKESYHDRLGKPLTRDVTKTISRPVA